MGRSKKYSSEARVSLKMDTDQKDRLTYYSTKLGFTSLSHLIKACINKGFPLVKEERNGQGDWNMAGATRPQPNLKNLF